MTQPVDIRWKQRFANYQKAIGQLREFLLIARINKYEKQGLIQAFEYTFELAWNVMKDYFTYAQADVDIMGSRDAIRTAFKRGLIEDGELWMDMINSRIASVHTYNEEVADAIVQAIMRDYIPLFNALETKMTTLLP
ncbi:MAG: nucleotidyltransferase substrate binding protein [Prevotellaceae bacterium]|jgi:nucleotidyltransferase substrate binding protein (TIGR01987 family)|nr:nucleotidyltransferase substrate binding protein [Prevotellaceae bacterium]